MTDHNGSGELATRDLTLLTDGELAKATKDLDERAEALRREMAPLTTRLEHVQTDKDLLATERRRRQRAAERETRAQARTRAHDGTSQPLGSYLEDTTEAEETPLSTLPLRLTTGGVVALGFASRPGTLALTDGVESKSVMTVGEARTLLEAGWELGTPKVRGVRIHLKGTRNERVVDATGVVVDAPAQDASPSI